MEQFSLWGTVVNVLTVLAGSSIGMLIKHFMGRSKSQGMEQLSDTVLKGLGLCVMVIGISGAVADGDTLVMILSVAIGAVIGHLLRLDHGITVLGEKVETLTRARFGNVAQGFVSASLLFCVGSMTVVGALNSGLIGDHSMLYTKSLLDFVSSTVFAASMGIGVMFAAAFVLVFQGSITLLAVWVAPLLNTEVITCMTCVGSVLIIGLALNMLGITKLKIMNYLPAIFLPIGLIPLANWLATLI